MIACSCARCGSRFSIEPRFAGRPATCPSCKQQTVAAPPGRPGAKAPGTPVAKASAELRPSGGRYAVEQEIARGGMGVVVRALDQDIRREVAIKYLLDQGDPRKKTRFIDEAQITGQLEHPNVVPIHELGVDGQNRLFFAMKMVKGRSLAQVLDDLRCNVAGTAKEYSLSRLLNVFINICNALAYAHSRGVVHRDLKPANIMLGDFGEVYVMDWGLAKVAKHGAAVAEPAAGRQLVLSGASAALAAVVAANGKPTASPASSMVATSREPDTDLTRDGAVVGTPVYMAPEQATGRVQSIDQRSDVYALGAVLYEMLTLHPPIDREGGSIAVLMRVADNAILPAEERNPRRARAGQIPAELSAIARKALAKEPQNRYPSAAALRQDIERFQEGRSVSAKDDTLREVCWKLVKRNKGASITAAAACLLLAVLLCFGFRAIYRAKESAETALQALQQEQRIKRERGQKSAPFFLREAKLSADQKRFDNALAQADAALEFDPELPEALLLKGQLLIVQKDFSAAQKWLAAYVQMRSADREAAELLELCKRVLPGDGSDSAPFIAVLQRQKAFSLAEHLEQNRDKLLALYRQRIQASWPGLGDRLGLDGDGRCRLELGGCAQVSDLSPLRGMPLTYLGMGGCAQVRDLAPLRGMPLTTLILGGCTEVVDLTPLQGLPLTTLNLVGCWRLRDLSPLQGMRLTSLSLYGCGGLRDVTPLQGMPLSSLTLSHCGSLNDVTPLGSLTLTELYFHPKYVQKGTDALRRMKSLKTIGVDDKTKFSPEEFWKRFDAGEFHK
jgi:serine/threonine protein kinase